MEEAEIAKMMASMIGDDDDLDDEALLKELYSMTGEAPPAAGAEEDDADLEAELEAKKPEAPKPAPTKPVSVSAQATVRIPTATATSARVPAAATQTAGPTATAMAPAGSNSAAVSVRASPAAVAKAPAVTVSPETAAALAQYKAILADLTNKAKVLAQAGKKSEATVMAAEAKAVDNDIKQLLAGVPAATVGAAYNHRQEERRRREVRTSQYRTLLEAIATYDKQRLAEYNELKEKLRMPGIPEAERKRLAGELEAAQKERETLRLTHAAVTSAHSNPTMPPAPLWHWGVKVESVALTNDDLGYDDIELQLTSIITLLDSKGAPEKGEFYIQAVLPFPPDAPTNIKTANFKLDTTASAALNHRSIIKMKRSTPALQRAAVKAIERRPAILEVYKVSHGFLGFGAANTVTARAGVYLSNLSAECTAELKFKLLSPDKIPDVAGVVSGAVLAPPALTRRTPAAGKSGEKTPTGGEERGLVVGVIRSHSPFVEADQTYKTIERRVFVLDESPQVSTFVSAPIPVTPVPSPVASAVTPASTAVAPTAARPTIPSPAASAPTPAASPATGAKAESGKPAQLPMDPAKAMEILESKLRIKGSVLDKAIKRKGDKESGFYFDHDNGAFYASFSTMQWAMGRSDVDEFLKTQLLPARMTILRESVQAGALTIPEYELALRFILQKEIELIKALTASGLTAEAALVTERAKLTQADLKSLQQNLELPSAAPTAPAPTTPAAHTPASAPAPAPAVKDTSSSAPAVAAPGPTKPAQLPMDPAKAMDILENKLRIKPGALDRAIKRKGDKESGFYFDHDNGAFYASFSTIQWAMGRSDVDEFLKTQLLPTRMTILQQSFQAGVLTIPEYELALRFVLQKEVTLIKALHEAGLTAEAALVTERAKLTQNDIKEFQAALQM